VLSSLYHGRIGQPPMPSAASADEPDLQPGEQRLYCTHGQLGAQPPWQPVRHGEYLCLSIGQPRFQDPALARVASEQGPAAAWIAALQAHGAQAPAGVHGRHATIVIRDNPAEAWLISDRFGTWPLCYAFDGPDAGNRASGGLSFSARANAVPGQHNAAINLQSIFDYLYFHMIPAPQTLFDTVHRLPAGHVLHWTPQRVHIAPWWTPHFEEHARPDFDTAKARFLELVRTAVTRETQDGQAVGTFLSGGTDSSTVCGMLCQALGEPARSYSIGFDANGYDEMAYARIAAHHFGADHRAYYVTPDDLLDGIPRIATHYDQPFGNSSAVPAWICASRARQDGIGKLLAGDGGDELFGGNARYARQRVFGWYEGLPGGLRSHLLEPLLDHPLARKLPPLRKAASYTQQAKVPLPDRMQMYNMLLRLGTGTLFTDAFLSQVRQHAPLEQQRDIWRSIHADSQIDRMLAYDWKYTLSDNDLPKVVGSTQLAGLEVAFPFLDDALLAFSTSLPPEWKLRRLTLRWFFKESLRGFLPDAIIAKKKHGFGLPFGVWACSHDGLRALASDSLHSFTGRGILRPEFTRALFDTHLPSHPGYYGELVWIIMMMELWFRQHAPDFCLTSA
jgi:asparagine synthase (glutamine-hydrolysing)